MRHLRIAPVGNLRRRWASYLITDREVAGKEETYERLQLVTEEDGGLDEEVEWSMPIELSCKSSDPLDGHKPMDSRAHLWNDGVDPSPPTSVPSSPSTARLCHKAKEAGFSSAEIDAAVQDLEYLTVREKALASSTSQMYRSTTLARKIMSALMVGSRRRPTDPWKGPLPQKRVSPPLTLGSCSVKVDQRSSDFGRRQIGVHLLGSTVEDTLEILNQDKSLVGHGRGKPKEKPRPGVWLKSGPSWTRVQLMSVAGFLLRCRGKLPLEFRSPVSGVRALAQEKPSYPEILRSSMENGGYGHGAPQGSFATGGN